MTSELINSIKRHQQNFGLALTEESLELLESYHSLITEHNRLLHLVGPTTVDEFATRHVLESLILLEYLPQKTRFADVGSGGGLPAIPCLLVREDLRAQLIESKKKKSDFLELALEKLGISDRASVVNRQFQEADPGNCEFVTCRALDKFTEKLQRLLKWSMRRHLLLFGGPNLREELTKQEVQFEERLLPMSEQRLLFIVRS